MEKNNKTDYALLHWKTLAWLTVRDTLSWLFVALTLIASLIAFLPDEEALWLRQIIPFCAYHVWVPAVALVLIAGVALLFNWPRTKAVYKDKNTDISIIIECCDVLQQKGLKVIHTVDTFDTELDRIISPRTLHGAFLQLCRQQHINLDEQIDAALEHRVPRSVNENLPGRKKQYGLGSVCGVKVGDEPYACVAFTRLQPNGTIEITKEEYIRCLKQMWRNLSDPHYKHDEVNVAVMGNKFVDLPAEFSTEQKIDLMIQTFFVAAREKACCRTLRICVHPNNVTDIDFDTYPTIIAHLAKRPVI